ncbi:Prenylated Rab acceptor 1 [Diaporthe eres]|uniref:Prenylated Rab acceptor 1 n=1 Tax=Diaporthe eres TaxID=83184 RepID=A0ABR1PNU0_DIAER
MVRSRRRAYEQSDEDDDDTSDSDQDSELEAGSETQLALQEKENALVETALRRIRRAQAKGKQEVKLNKKELAALEQRRKRMQAESGGSKKKKREQRYAVPLSQLGPISQKENRALVAPDDTLPPHPSPGTFERTQEGRLQPPLTLEPSTFIRSLLTASLIPWSAASRRIMDATVWRIRIHVINTLGA